MVNTYKLKLTPLQSEILNLLFVKSGSNLNQRRIAINLNVSPPAVLKALPNLQKQNLVIISKDKESKRLSIELNSVNQRVIGLKRAHNLYSLYESNLVSYLSDNFAGGTIIVFGSYSRGEDTVNSDIDLAIIGRKQKDIDLKKFDEILGRKISLNFYDSFKEINAQLKNNILSGITLVGGIEL